MSGTHRDYYAGHVMDRVNQIQLAVIGLGIAILAINYLSLVTFDSDVLTSPLFWQRLVLLMLVILFASYTALVYNAYPVRMRNSESDRIVGGYPIRIFALFLIDIFQVAIAAGMFGVLFVPGAYQLHSSELCGAGLAAQGCIGFSEHAIEMIFVLGAFWHLSATAWYAISDGVGVRDVRVHGAFAVVYAGLVSVSYHVDWFGPWIAAGSFAAVLLALFLVQGQRWLSDD